MLFPLVKGESVFCSCTSHRPTPQAQLGHKFPAKRSRTTGPRRQNTNLVRRPLVPKAGEDGELELAVFRFTLGIPGFDDAYIPRVAGAGGLLLLALNHFLSPGPPPDAQATSEVLAIVLATICMASPTIEARLKELEPGRGRQAAAQQIEGASRVFGIADNLSLDQKQELAWASFALLRNTNTCSVLALVGEEAVLARGAVASVTGQADAGKICLGNLRKAKDSFKSLLSKSSTDNTVYLPDKSAIASAAMVRWQQVVPAGVESILLHRISAAGGSGSDVWLMLLSERPRAWSNRERLWGAAIARKLQGCW